MIIENNYRQLITDFTTDNRTKGHTNLIKGHTNLMNEEIHSDILETYFSDHKAIWASLN